MTGRRGKRHSLLLLPLLLLSATAARAEQTAYYQVTGPIGAALWGLGYQPGTEALAYAFSHVTPIRPQATTAAAPLANAPVELPPPGPRLAFTVSQWVLVNKQWVRRQWYGDVPMPVTALGIAATLSDGKLDATVLGTLVEMSEDGVVVRKDIPGRIQVNWTAYGRLANTSLSYTYQTPSYAATLQTAGMGRASRTTATVTVAALGDPIEIWGFGTLSSVKTGLLSVKQQ